MRKLLIAVAAIVILLAIVVGVGQWLNTSNNAPHIPGAPETTESTEAINPPGCSAKEFISAPGTWESNPMDDPMNPTANPNSFMLSISNPLKQEFGEDQLKVWTLPYTAQFKNFNAMHEMSYDDSRREGYDRMAEELRTTHEACPATKFIIAGFSQGAVIAGDMAAEIGNGRGPVPASSVIGVSLVADGRQEEGKGNLIGNIQNTGVGAEISLSAVSGLVQLIVPGASMRGPRPDGFGELNDRVNNFCAPGDMICDSPRDFGNAIARAQELVAGNAVHAQYATNPAVIAGQTTPQWIVDWARGLTNGS
ncbi:cutinase family protein [Corynebacterium suicordis]